MEDSPELPISREQNPDEILKNLEEYMTRNLAETALDALLDNVEHIRRYLSRDASIRALKSVRSTENYAYFESNLRVKEGVCAILEDRIQHRSLTDERYRETFDTFAQSVNTLSSSILSHEKTKKTRIIITEPMAKQEVASAFLKIYNSHKQALGTRH